MSLHSEYRELGIKRNRGQSSLNRQHGDGDADDLAGQEVPERDGGKDDKHPYAAYLMVNGEGVVEPLKGRLKVHATIKKASVCKTERRAERLIKEWQEAYDPPEVEG